MAGAAKNNLAASIGRWKNDDYKLAGKASCRLVIQQRTTLYRDYYKKNKDKTLIHGSDSCKHYQKIIKS
jgi:hypothetical protein